jgi:hypothetical protein
MFIYRMSSYIGSGSSKECGLAILAVAGSWIISLIPYMAVDKSKYSTFIIVFMSALVARMLITCVLVMLILKNVDLRRNVLIIWVAAIYLMFLAVDTYLNVRYLRSHDFDKKEFFADEDNEFYINDF